MTQPPRVVLVLSLCLSALVSCRAPEQAATPLASEGAPAAGLSQELIAMGEQDQQARQAWIQATRSGDQDEAAAAAQRTVRIDRENVARLKQIIDKHGWPTRTMVGPEAAQAAWLIVQHATFDLEFQARMLPQIEEAARAGEASLSNYALLLDRVRLAQGRKQVYGSQVTRGDNGEWTPRDLEDPENVDARRADVGLPPLEAYLRVIEQTYGEPADADDDDNAGRSGDEVDGTGR